MHHLLLGADETQTWQPELETDPKLWKVRKCAVKLLLDTQHPSTLWSILKPEIWNLELSTRENEANVAHFSAFTCF